MRNNKQLAKFIIPSVIGIMLFMIPIKYDGGWTILVKILADKIGSLLGSFLPLLCTIIITASAAASLIALAKPKFIMNNSLLKDTFVVSPIWLVVRVIGAVFICLTYFGIDAGDDASGLIHMITCGDDGGFVLDELLTVLVIIFAIAGLLLPLLLDFGLLELIGALCTRIMRPLFKIPGRAAVDCVTSWIGDGTLGVMLTCNQYEGGYYSTREASVVATTFSAVSITFSIVVLAQVDLMEYFGIYYLIICLVGVVCAVICPRIPPLSLKKDTYVVEGKAMPETIPEGYKNSLDYGIDLAMKRVAEHRGIGQFLENGIKNSVGMWFGVLPTVMAIGTLALILANFTSIFEVLGTPFRPLLEFLQVPEAG
ncbi:MAG: YjiH family protein, partial [Bacillota bacterium]|nr:YjiH family protein [Bacillota bacterium]